VRIATKLLLITALGFVCFAAPKKTTKDNPNAVPVLWQDPGDVASRDMTWGPGGPAHQPRGPFRFVKEDMNGTSAKFDITDADGTKWKVKLGAEAHPETAASRLVWAVGYFADEEYYLPSFQVQGVPQLRRGAEYVEPNGIVHGARLKRYLKGEEKEGHWEWRANPFFGSREFNGLRVMMALINNWDLKDENNGVYVDDGKRIYLVTDLGASFGTTSRRLTRDAGKGNLANYTASTFVAKTTPQFVDFGTPSRPAALLAIDPGEFRSRVDMEWIGRGIPVADARWIGSILARLTPQQIEAAFAAAGYSPAEVVGFSHVVEQRIGELHNLPAQPAP
jgi:hypothetical protein